MAILQAYRKVEETDLEVRYAYGYPEMNRYLVIQKDRESYLAEDGQEDGDTRAVLLGILGKQRELNVWPMGGGVQH